MKEVNSIYKFNSLTEFHRVFGLAKPLHPLISFIDIADIKHNVAELPSLIVMDFYKIAYKPGLCGNAKYGQSYYDFGEGGLIFTSPNQVFEAPSGTSTAGSLLLVHPDFFLSYALAKNIIHYGFFSYAVNEALHLSDSERATIMSVFKIINEELNSKIDDFSQDVIVSQVELLLNYCNRFSKRQFITRKAVHVDVLQKLESILDNYFENEQSLKQGLPTVQFLSEQLNISASYLGDMMRSLTGQNAQQHIHHKLIEKAKEMLSTSDLTVAEVAYQLGFEHPQSFSRLFKTKTKLSPLAFRQQFN